MDFRKPWIVVCVACLMVACTPVDNPPSGQGSTALPDSVETPPESTPGSNASFEINTNKDGDQVIVSQDGNSTLFEVRSPSGIGGAQIVVTGGELTDPARVRFFLNGLENMSLYYEDVLLTLSVSSSDPELVLQTLQIGSESPQDLQPGSPYWMEVGQPTNPVNQERYFEVTLPAAFFEASPSEFELSWIDFYR